MAQVTIYLDKETEKKARTAASRTGKSLSAWLREIIQTAPEGKWPPGFAELFGSFDNDKFVAPKRVKPEPVKW
ncbi:MAG: hypothetical protein WAK31_11800 [Chthoniobacterales bacterium]